MTNPSSPIGTVDSGVIATVDARGNIAMADGSAPLRWFVAADDRWHDPSIEVAVRQNRVGGTPVLETRLRVPGGDVVQRVWAAVGPGSTPCVVVEFENDSRMAVAVAVTRRDVVLARPGSDRTDSGEWPAPGLDLPEPPVVLPLAHQATIRVAVIPRSGIRVSELPSHEAVVRGWSTLVERGPVFAVADLLDARPLTERLVEELCSLVLDPPPAMVVGSDPGVAARWLLDTREARRLGVGGDEPHEVATAVEILLRSSPTAWDPLSAAAVRAAAELLCGDHRALRDLDRAVSGSRHGSLYPTLAPFRLPVETSLERGTFVAALSESMALPVDRDVVVLVPDGLSDDRRGSDFEVRRVSVGGGRMISFAVRWHGPNAAVLWEVEPAGSVELRSGADAPWRDRRPAGEGLWRMSGPEVDGSVSVGSNGDQSFS